MRLSYFVLFFILILYEEREKITTSAHKAFKSFRKLSSNPRNLKPRNYPCVSNRMVFFFSLTNFCRFSCCIDTCPFGMLHLSFVLIKSNYFRETEISINAKSFHAALLQGKEKRKMLRDKKPSFPSSD